MDFWVVSGVPYQWFCGTHVDFLVLVSAEGVETTSSILCSTEQVTVSVNLGMIWLVWIQSRLRIATYRRDAKEVDILRCAQR